MSEDWQAGFDAAVAVIRERYFDGPTKDMMLGWFTEALSSHPGSEQS